MVTAAALDPGWIDQDRFLALFARCIDDDIACFMIAIHIAGGAYPADLVAQSVGYG